MSSKGNWPLNLVTAWVHLRFGSQSQINGLLTAAINLLYLVFRIGSVQFPPDASSHDTIIVKRGVKSANKPKLLSVERCPIDKVIIIQLY